jgi:hypothetical protein
MQFQTRHGIVSVTTFKDDEHSIYIDAIGGQAGLGLQCSLDEARMIAKELLDHVIRAEPNQRRDLLEADLRYLEDRRAVIKECLEWIDPKRDENAELPWPFDDPSEEQRGAPN